MNTNSPNWHRFDETDDGDEACTRCRVVVSPEAQMTFSIPCPAGECAGKASPDGACVFVPRRSGPSCCIYCGRAGDKDPLPPELREEFAAGMIPLADYLDCEAMLNERYPSESLEDN